MERLLHILVLLYVHFFVLDQNNCALVVILAAVIWRREDRDYRRECRLTTPSVHLVAVVLHLMRPDDRQVVILSEQFFDRFQSKFHRALTLTVLSECHLSRIFII